MPHNKLMWLIGMLIEVGVVYWVVYKLNPMRRLDWNDWYLMFALFVTGLTLVSFS